MADPRLSDALYILWEFVTKWLVVGWGVGCLPVWREIKTVRRTTNTRNKNRHVALQWVLGGHENTCSVFRHSCWNSGLCHWKLLIREQLLITAMDTVDVLQRKFDKDRLTIDANIFRVALFTVGRLSSAPIKLLMLKTLLRVQGHRIGGLETGDPAETIANRSNRHCTWLVYLYHGEESFLRS